MIATWVLDRIACRWVLHYLTAGARAALPHVSALSLVGLCGGASPPPPAWHQPPAPPVLTHVPPDAGWPQLPPAWRYAPGVGPSIPIGIPVLPAAAPILAENTRDRHHDTSHVAELVPAPFTHQRIDHPSLDVPDCLPPVPAPHVPEPEPLAVVGVAVLGLFAFKRKQT